MTTVLRLFSYENWQAGIGEPFHVGDFNDITYLTVEYANKYENKVDTRLSTTSFWLKKGYGVTFYEGKDFRNSFRTFLAGESDVHRAFTGPNMSDRSIGGMKFERSNNVMIHNIRSLKIFKLPDKTYCEKPKISDIDLCEKAYGSDIIKMPGDEYRGGISVPGSVTKDIESETEFQIMPSGLTPDEERAWLRKYGGTGGFMSGKGKWIILLVALIFIAMMSRSMMTKPIIPVTMVGINPLTGKQGIMDTTTGLWLM